MFDFAELEEIEAGVRGPLGVEVDDYVSERRFEQH